MDANHPLLALASDGPPPFPTSYPQLRRLDRSVVCPICKEPFQGPVSIGCGHSFCSQVRVNVGRVSRLLTPHRHRTSAYVPLSTS